MHQPFPGSCLGRYHTDRQPTTRCRTTRFRTPPRDRPRRRVSHNKSGEPAATRRGVGAAGSPGHAGVAAWPDGQRSPRVVMAVTDGTLLVLHPGREVKVGRMCSHIVTSRRAGTDEQAQGPT